MIPVIVLFVYLAIIATIGLVAFKKGQSNTEDFFLASRTIGPMVFFLSLFATNMTAFAILGSSGLAYKRGIGIYGLMASSSGFVIPLTIFFIGTRLWALGKRFGHQTQVQFFRARWECDAIGTVIFLLSAAMLVPYMIISIMGGGTVLQEISLAKGAEAPMIPYWLGCAIVVLVVTINVFFGGMRGTVWVNIFQTILFLCFGFVAMIVISRAFPGGFGEIISKIAGNPKSSFLLDRARMPKEEFWSYTLIPLSSIMFPHMAIMCFSARKMEAFKKTVVIYPIAIMLIWLPCIFLGVIGASVIPGLKDSDGILLRLLGDNAPAWLAGLLGAGIISAVMGSDAHQVLAMSTMFTKDIYVHYGGREKYGEKAAVYFARAFILVVTVIAYLIALYLKAKQGIFEIAIRFAFSGFAAMAPVMIAALFWKRSTKWGALASTVFVAATLILFACLQGKPVLPPAPATKPAAMAKSAKPDATTNDRTFTVAASGNATSGYQWVVGGLSISGVTNTAGISNDAMGANTQATADAITNQATNAVSPGGATNSRPYYKLYYRSVADYEKDEKLWEQVKGMTKEELKEAGPKLFNDPTLNALEQEGAKARKELEKLKEEVAPNVTIQLQEKLVADYPGEIDNRIQNLFSILEYHIKTVRTRGAYFGEFGRSTNLMIIPAKSESADTKTQTNDSTKTIVPHPTKSPTGAPPGPKMDVIWKVGDHVILSRTPATGDVRFWNYTKTPTGGFMAVVPMVFGSALCMIVFSLLTKPPGRETIEKYFPAKR